jgi:hypothetical protein
VLSITEAARPAAPAAPADRGAPTRRRSSRPRPTWLATAGAMAVAAGVLRRLGSTSALWLDEAQAVAIARLPLTHMLDALRQDGAPPLYYLLLHGWMRLFGTSAAAVRLLSGALSIATLPLARRAGRHIGGRRVADAAVVLVATSPFAIRYATEARMYALVLALTFALLTLVLDPERPRSGVRLGAIAATVAALLLTHYWSMFLIAVLGLSLLWRSARHAGERRDSLILLATIGVGSLAFVPWVPSFLTQLAHTGAPWGRPPGMAIIEDAVRGFAGALSARGDIGLPSDAAHLLSVLLLVLAGGAIVSAWTGVRGGRSVGGSIALFGFGIVLLGGLSLQLTRQGFAPRHAAAALPPLLLAISAVIAGLEPARVRRGVLGLMAVLGLVAGASPAVTPRTQAPEIADILRSQMRPGDVVATCPDQLAPALDRLLPQASVWTLPGPNPPGRIDWTDYRRRIHEASAEGFAAQLDLAAGQHAVWLVWSPNYVAIGKVCRGVRQQLEDLRPGGVEAVRLRSSVFENAGLWYAPAGS